MKNQDGINGCHNNVEAVLSIVKGFGIDVKAGEEKNYKCTWLENAFEFDLRIFADGQIIHQEGSSSTLITVLCLNEKKESIFHDIESFDILNGHLIICDEEEDIQNFAKDFWNLLVDLSKQS